MNPDDLERLIDAELRRLPAPVAPPTLLPRVLAAAAHRQASPIPAHGGLASPPAWQAGWLAAAATMATVFVLALPWLAASGGEPGPFATLLDILGRTSAVVRVSWRLLVAPLAVWTMAAAIVLSLGCAALWSALDRVALGGASES